MKQKINFQPILIILGVLVMSLLVGYLVFAWTPPTVAPPGGNVPAPLNVSTIPQTKPGVLTFSRFVDADLNPWFVDPSAGEPDASAVFRGRVGIGTTSPITGKLVVSGGNVDVTTNRIINLVAPIAPSDAATKGYVDAGRSVAECYVFQSSSDTGCEPGFAAIFSSADTGRSNLGDWMYSIWFYLIFLCVWVGLCAL